ncbi:MAG: response regulator [Candidatus Eremiobacterota bacterium]
MSVILVLDDDQLLRSTIAENLEEEGYEVHQAASGPDALVMAASHDFDLIVADVRMAGMDGLECLAALKKLQPNARSIVITGYADEDAPSRAVKVQASDYLYKPFRLHELLTAVNRVLEARKEQATYGRLLGGLLAGARKLVGAAAQAMQEGPALDSHREQVFQGFYVGVRSRKLTQSEALLVWDQLERLEERREGLRTGQAAEGRQDLVQGYNYLMDVITAFQRTDMYIHQKRAPGQIDTQRFGEFYQRVRNGELSLEQVKLAPFLRILGAEVMQSQELQDLYKKVWGALPA